MHQVHHVHKYCELLSADEQAKYGCNGSGSTGGTGQPQQDQAVQQMEKIGDIIANMVQNLQAQKMRQQNQAMDSSLIQAQKNLNFNSQQFSSSTAQLQARLALMEKLEKPISEIDETVKKHLKPDPELQNKVKTAMTKFNGLGSTPIDLKQWDPKRKLEVADVPVSEMSGESIQETRQAVSEKRKRLGDDLRNPAGQIVIATVGEGGKPEGIEIKITQEMLDDPRNKVIITGCNGRAIVEYPDGAKIWVKEASTFTILGKEGQELRARHIKENNLNEGGNLAVTAVRG